MKLKGLLLNHMNTIFLYIHNNLMYSAIRDKTVCTLYFVLASTCPQGDSTRAFIITPHGNVETLAKVILLDCSSELNEGPVLSRLVGDGGTVC